MLTYMSFFDETKEPVCQFSGTQSKDVVKEIYIEEGEKIVSAKVDINYEYNYPVNIQFILVEDIPEQIEPEPIEVVEFE